MTVGMMNHVTLDWLVKLHPKLPKLIQLEFGTQLRVGQISSLVNQIANCLDSIAAKNNFSIRNAVMEAKRVQTQSYQDEGDPSLVRYTQFNNQGFQPRGRGRGARGAFRPPFSASPQFTRGRGHGRSRPTQRGGGRGVLGTGAWCTECYTRSQTQKRPIHYTHLPSECPALQVNIGFVEQEEHLEEPYYDENAIEEEETEDYHYGNDYLYSQNKFEIPPFQEMREKLNCGMKHITPIVNEITDVANHNVLEPVFIPEVDGLTARLRQISSAIARIERTYAPDGVWKEVSPVILLNNGGQDVRSTVDTGAEVGCISEAYALQKNISFAATNHSAITAGSLGLRLSGETSDIRLSESANFTRQQGDSEAG